MPFADRVPVNCTHSTMLWPKWGVPITGSTGLHYLLCALQPSLVAVVAGTILWPPSLYLASATGSRYASPLAIIAQAMRAILLASAMAATFTGRRSSSLVSQGRCRAP
jgi:hypothetical protein